MSLPELIVIRHGETEWNRSRRLQGGQDSPLTAKGREQANNLAQQLVTHGVGPKTHRLFSSPQGRALATAAPISSQTGLTVEPDDRLREIHMGQWAGLTRDEVDARWPASDPHEHFIDWYARAPDGEPFESRWDRVGAFLYDLRGPTVIVTHGFTSRFLRTRALGLTLADLAEVRGGQGVAFVIRNGRHEILGS
jgi:probable phosphoglycerate mutase